MISNEQARDNAKLSHASYGDVSIPLGYSVVNTGDRLTDPNTGFNAIIVRRDGTNEYTVAFTGTQDGQDWAANAALGQEQWKRNKDKVFAELDALSASKITFTGHSLGGALPQYAAYDYLKKAKDANLSAPPVSLVTFNGLGGMAGLRQLHPNAFDPAIASQIDAAHFFTRPAGGVMDRVSRLKMHTAM